jgi:hypothetical protein
VCEGRRTSRSRFSHERERERERDGGSWPKYHITAQCNSMFAGYIDNLFIAI